MSSTDHWPPDSPTIRRPPTRDRDPAAPRSRTDPFSALTCECRRRILAILMDGSEPVALDDLATRLAAVEDGVDPVAVSVDRTEDLRVDLRHVHLPPLAEVGLLAWAPGEETVAVTDHPAYADPGFRELVQTSASVDGVLDALASPRRRLVLAVLRAADGVLDREELARRVSDFEGPEHTEDYVDEVLATLHHVHLPKLSEAGIVERDCEVRTVRYRGHPHVDDAWFGP